MLAFIKVCYIKITSDSPALFKPLNDNPYNIQSSDPKSLCLANEMQQSTSKNTVIMADFGNSIL